VNGVWLASYLLLWVLVLSVVFAIIVLARQIGVLHMRILPAGARAVNAGPSIGSVAPEISTFDIEGHPLNLGGSRRVSG
jgi:hypothetical protein